MKVNRCVKCMKEIEAYPCPNCGFDTAQEPQPAFALPWNTILHGRYLIGKVLGQGGFGITYVGWDLLLEIKVAIKEYYPSGQASRQNPSTKLTWYTTGGRSPDGNSGDAFLKEARKMAKIGSVPEIVRVLDTFCENETAYIVMEFVEGTTLKELAEKNGPMSFEDCARLLLPLLEGLDKVHAQGLIHRDISPDNIMQQTDGALRLLDFGAAKDTSAQKSGNSQLVAKHGFSPVEQYTANGKVGPWTDVYAICATMYYMITGETLPDSLERLDGDTLDFSKVKKKPLSKAQEAILSAGLAVRSENRTQSVGVLAEQLKGTVAPPPPPPPPPKDKKKLIIGCCAVAAAAVVAVAAFSLLRPGAPVTVEALGCSNASKHGGSLMVERSEEYIYYDDKDYRLYMSAYDAEDETFYIGTEGNQGLDDRAFFLNLGQDAVYYLHDGDEDDTLPDTIYRVVPKGGGKTALIEGDQYWYLQYARLSNGKEYLYYTQENGDTEDFLYELFRYDLETGESERLLEEDIYWYNLDGEYLYYVTFEDPLQGTQWKRAALNGEKPEVLNDSDSLTNGFIEDGTAYMFSLSKELLLQFDRDGNPVNKPLAIYDGCSTFGDGWLYYSLTGSGEVHRVLPDGSNDTVIVQNRNITNLCYHTNYLWMVEEEEINGEVVPMQSFMVRKNGNNLIEIDARTEAVLGGLTPGVQYAFEGDTLVLTGYSGSSDHIIVPWEVAGVAVSQIRTADSFPDVDVYTYPQTSELTWETNEDGTGVILTAYTPGPTEGSAFRVLPAMLDSLPVVEIGESLFEEDETLEGVILLDGVQVIGESAFQNCSVLAYAELPGTLKSIQNDAFFGTDALTSITLPEGIEDVGFDAFWGGGLKSIHIPASVETLYGNPFSTNNLQEVTMDGGNSAHNLVDGAIYTSTSLKVAPTTRTGTLTIPAGIESVSQNGCCFSDFDTVVLPSSMKHIYNYAFAYSYNLTSINLPEGLEDISTYAFYRCSKLTDITIPRSVTAIKTKAFAGCGLQSVTLPRNCEVAADAFDSGVQINYYD